MRSRPEPSHLAGQAPMQQGSYSGTRRCNAKSIDAAANGWPQESHPGTAVAKTACVEASMGILFLMEHCDMELALTRLRYVTVEGCIGVGKTTLTHLLSGALGARTVLEVVEDNPFLADFYKDQAAHAFKTQMFFLLSRFKQQEALQQGDLFDGVVVSDYLFAKDRIFAELTLSPSELMLYDQIFRALHARLRSPDLVIYLHAPMDVILERIARRGRSFEKDIDRGYLESLVDAYGRFFSSYAEAPVLMVDTVDLNFPARHGDLDVIVDALARFPEPGTDEHARRQRLTVTGRPPTTPPRAPRPEQQSLL
jgi:deoxyguanosine kinase